MAAKSWIPFGFFVPFSFRPLLRSTSWCENWAGLCQDGTSWSSHVRFMDETMWRVAASKSLGAKQRSKKWKLTWWLLIFGEFFEEKGIRDKRNPLLLGGWIVCFCGTTLKNEHVSGKMMVGRLCSFWNGPLLGWSFVNFRVDEFLLGTGMSWVFFPSQ